MNVAEAIEPNQSGAPRCAGSAEEVTKQLEETPFYNLDGYRVEAMEHIGRAIVRLQTALGEDQQAGPGGWDSHVAEVNGQLGQAHFLLEFLGEQLLAFSVEHARPSTEGAATKPRPGGNKRGSGESGTMKVAAKAGPR